MAKSGIRIAVFALARTGTKEVAYLLEPDLTSSDASIRLSAMRSLVSLGEPVRVASLLADDDAHVRMTTSCTVLGAPR